jgi:NAD(P)-dependent dehydrogenase (short-subunit alcohol dehydrogenase family)
MLRGRVVWLTGAAGGFGTAISRMFAEEGVRLLLIDLDAEGLARLADELRAAGAEVEHCVLDVADGDAVERHAPDWVAHWGRVDVLVNNAATNVRGAKHLDGLQREDWERVLRVNLQGAYHMVQAALPAMRRQRDGLVINVSSGAGKLVTSALPGTAYTVAKHGLNGLSHSISREEAAHGIRATALMPGEANTPWARRHSGVQYTGADRARLVQPEDVARIVRFLAELPSHVTIPELPLNPTHKVLKAHHRFPD